MLSRTVLLCTERLYSSRRQTTDLAKTIMLANMLKKKQTILAKLDTTTATHSKHFKHSYIPLWWWLFMRASNQKNAHSAILDKIWYSRAASTAPGGVNPAQWNSHWPIPHQTGHQRWPGSHVCVWTAEVSLWGNPIAGSQGSDFIHIMKEIKKLLIMNEEILYTTV